MLAKSTAIALVTLFAATANAQSQSLTLTVPPGAPLRLYLTKRVPKRLNAPVEAKLLTPVYAFDREVIPSGTPVLGHVTRLEPVPRWRRIRAILGGDFTPLHIADIQFTSILIPGAPPLDLHTLESPGLRTLVPLIPPKQRTRNAPPDNAGIVASAKQAARDQIDAGIDRVRGIPGLVRGTDKKELIYDYAMSKLPYHPQTIHNRTRFDAELAAPLQFGSENVTQESFALLGSQPEPGSTAHARLLTSLDSLTSVKGQKVEAVLEQPLFSSERKLILPEGTRVEGSVTAARRARWFHRSGRLRFSFQSVELPAEVAAMKFEAQPAALPQLRFPTQASLNAAESGSVPLKVDREGGVQAEESKKRYIALAVSVLIARSSADNDVRRDSSGAIDGRSSNRVGGALGGGLGFGLLGSIAAQRSTNVGRALGYYGLAWSVYSNVIARGLEVHFDKNAAIDIGFNQREK